MTTISSTYAVFANDRTVDYPYVTYEADRIPDDGSVSSSEVPGTRTTNWDEAYKMACERSEEERLAYEEEAVWWMRSDFIAIYWCNKVTEVETDKLRKRIDELDEKINRLLLVLDDSSEQACEILDSLSPQREESES